MKKKKIHNNLEEKKGAENGIKVSFGIFPLTYFKKKKKFPDIVFPENFKLERMNVHVGGMETIEKEERERERVRVCVSVRERSN